MPKYCTPAHELGRAGAFEKRGRMWQAIRQLRLFDASKLALCTENDIELARRFVAVLRRAGYIVAVDPSLPAKAWRKEYRLVRNSGPKVPMFLIGPGRAIIGALDRNDGRAYGLDGQPAPAVTEAARLAAGLSKQRLKSRRAGAR